VVTPHAFVTQNLIPWGQTKKTISRANEATRTCTLKSLQRLFFWFFGILIAPASLDHAKRNEKTKKTNKKTFSAGFS
jgi:hypothetical protein